MLAKQQSAWPFLVFHQKWTLVEGKGAFQTQTGLYLSEKNGFAEIIHDNKWGVDYPYFQFMPTFSSSVVHTCNYVAIIYSSSGNKSLKVKEWMEMHSIAAFRTEFNNYFCFLSQQQLLSLSSGPKLCKY